MQYLDAFLEKYPAPPIHFVGVPVNESLSKKQLIGIAEWLANHIKERDEFNAKMDARQMIIRKIRESYA